MSNLVTKVLDDDSRVDIPVSELKIGDRVEVTWNEEGLPMEEANGHYPNEKEVVEIIDEEEDEIGGPRQCTLPNGRTTGVPGVLGARRAITPAT